MRHFGILLLIASGMALACKPAADYRSPTLKENFSKAHVIFYGTVISTRIVENEAEIEFKVGKAWKGKAKDPAIYQANRSSTCDPFGRQVEKGQICVIFVGQNNKIISGLSGGDSSVCLDSSQLRSKKLMAEYNQKFSKFKDSIVPFSK